jgi:hypothetical protein
MTRCAVLLVLAAAMINPLILHSSPRTAKEGRTENPKQFATGSTPLLRFERGKEGLYTVAQSCESILTLSGTGGGKTSAIDATVCIAMMAKGYGILAASAKGDAADDIERWAAIAGRSGDVIRIRADGRHVFNFLDWVVRRSGGEAQINQAVDMLREMREVSGRGRLTSSGNENQFFEDKADQLNAAVMHVSFHAVGRIDADVCLRVINTIPQTPYEAQTTKTFCREMCEKALENCPEGQLDELRRDVEFLMIEMVSVQDRTRSSIVVTSTVAWNALTHPPLSRLFLGPSVITPQAILDGAIVCIDVPLSYGSGSRAAFVLWKMATQMAVLDRLKPGVASDDLRPVCVLAPEYHQYASSSDYVYTSICRQARGSLYLSTQSLNSLFAECGSGETGRAKMLALLSTINTRIYGCQSDDESLRFSSSDFGEQWVMRAGASGKPADSFWSVPGTVENYSVSYSPQREPLVPHESFQRLRRGTGAAGMLVGAYVRTLGPHGVRCYEVFFDQTIGTGQKVWRGLFPPENIVRLV